MKTELGKTSAPVPLGSPQILHGLALNVITRLCMALSEIRLNVYIYIYIYIYMKVITTQKLTAFHISKVLLMLKFYMRPGVA